MFTGIIAAQGEIDDVRALGDDADSGISVWVKAPQFNFEGLKIGDSIAINGACMTAVEFQPQRFRVEISKESLNRTVGLDRRGPVNLERSLKVGDSLDGHLVAGHVDGVGEVISFERTGESHTLVLRVDAALACYLAYKGSLAVHGVSLTVNQVEDHAAGCDVSINIIPHTFAHTTLQHLQAGDRVNLEIDPIARYVQRMVAMQRKP